MSNTVIVRGMKKKWFMDHFKEMAVYFGGDARGIPKRDADYIGFYLEAPVSAITHIGIVETIKRDVGGATFNLKAIIKLDEPVKTSDGHAIRKHEYWTLDDLGIKKIELVLNSFSISD